MSKPRIIVPLAFQSEMKESPRYFTRIAYATAIERAGGIPIFIGRPTEEDLVEIGHCMEGLLLMGGVDPDPRLYGEDVLPVCGEIDGERDRVELALLQDARKRGIPVLGLCRGFQIMNVGYGGALYQDIPSQVPGALAHAANATTERGKRMHAVNIEVGSRLAGIMGTNRTEVNSLHHQGIKTLGSGLRMSAMSPDGLIEGAEDPAHPFCVGVHWHPEELDDAASGSILSAFVDAARKYRETH